MRNLRKRTFLAALMALLAGAAAAQEKANLAVLPFTGGTGDEGEAIAELFSMSGELMDEFGIIPRTSITGAIRTERQFQTGTGMTDPDTIAKIGQQLGAQYVVAGNIAKLGNQSLLIISILKIDDLLQIAGGYTRYSRINEIQSKLPEMTRNIIAATKIDSTGFDNLAVVPVVLENNIDTRVSDTLAQILSINLIKRYAVYPRTSTLEQVQSEYKTQEEAAAEGNQVNIGKGENPRFVLGVRARRLDDENMFNALIINLETGLQYAGGSANYSTLDDGIQAMEELARKLTGAGGTEGGEFDGIRERARASAGRNAASSPSDTTDTTDTADSGGGKRFWGNFGYGALNLALGLGSFVQRDHWGGITCLMGYGMAGVFIAWELSLDYYDDLVGIPGAIGLGVAGVTALYGFIRPAVYNRSRALAAVIDNIHVSVGLGPEHENVVRLSYTLRF